jgi:magnesium-protoporphyrin IX monomethyl ester (oxidative) cyclase
MATLDRNFQDPPIDAALTFETSRGCWWGERAHCTFCGLNSDSMGYRAMRSANAVSLIQSLFKYAARTSRLECVDNIMPKSYLSEVFPNLNTPPNLTIFYEVKADLSDADLAVLAQARVHSLQPGIEALATSTLKLMKKGTSGLGNVRFLKDCVSHGIYPEWNLLVGFPGEDERVYEAYERDLPALMHLPPPSGVYPIRFDRFSPYHTKAAEFGLDLHPYDFYALVYPFPQQSLQQLAYYFIDRNFSAHYMTTTAKWIGRLRATIDPWKARWHGAGQAEAPRLVLKEDNAGARVFDSRGINAIEHPLTPSRRLLLDRLAAGATAEQLASACHLPIDTVVADLAWFSERRLLFREGDKFVSLVFLAATAMAGRQAGPTSTDAPPALVARDRAARRLSRTAATAGAAD